MTPGTPFLAFMNNNFSIIKHMANLQVNQQNTKRIALSELSKQVAPMVAAGQFDKVNEALIACYQSTEHRYFKTFNQWRR